MRLQKAKVQALERGKILHRFTKTVAKYLLSKEEKSGRKGVNYTYLKKKKKS